MVEAIEVIQATLAPSFLISGASIFLNFTQTRLFRVVDRLRAVSVDESGRGAREVLQRRARTLRNAIAVGVSTVAMTVITAIFVMAGVMFERPAVVGAAPWVFALAMISLLAALCLVLYDTIISVRAVTQDPAVATR